MVSGLRCRTGSGWVPGGLRRCHSAYCDTAVLRYSESMGSEPRKLLICSGLRRAYRDTTGPYSGVGLRSGSSLSAMAAGMVALAERVMADSRRAGVGCRELAAGRGELLLLSDYARGRGNNRQLVSQEWKINGFMPETLALQRVMSCAHAKIVPSLPNPYQRISIRSVTSGNLCNQEKTKSKILCAPGDRRPSPSSRAGMNRLYASLLEGEGTFSSEREDEMLIRHQQFGNGLLRVPWLRGLCGVQKVRRKPEDHLCARRRGPA